MQRSNIRLEFLYQLPDQTKDNSFLAWKMMQHAALANTSFSGDLLDRGFLHPGLHNHPFGGLENDGYCAFGVAHRSNIPSRRSVCQEKFLSRAPGY